MSDINKTLKTHPNEAFDAGDLVKQGAFGLVVAKTKTGEVVARPIGGDWGSGIRDSISEINEMHPGATYRLFLDDCNQKHFRGIVEPEQVLIW